MNEDIKKEVERQREEYDKDIQDLIDLVNESDGVNDKKDDSKDEEDPNKKAFDRAMDGID